MEDLSHFEEGHVRGPFRNLFNQDNKDREKSKKRLISRKWSIKWLILFVNQ